MGGQSGRPCEAEVGGLKWEAVGGPKWEDRVGVQGGRPCERPCEWPFKKPWEAV